MLPVDLCGEVLSARRVDLRCGFSSPSTPLAAVGFRSADLICMLLCTFATARTADSHSGLRKAWGSLPYATSPTSKGHARCCCFSSTGGQLASRCAGRSSESEPMTPCPSRASVHVALPRRAIYKIAPFSDSVPITPS